MALVRKPRRTALLPAEWEAQKHNLRKLYLQEKLTVTEIVMIMNHNYQFDASISQYRLQFKRWRFRKNFREEDWRFIHRTIEKRKRYGKDSLIYLDNVLVPIDKITTEVHRHVPLSDQHVHHLDLGSSEETVPGLFVSTPASMALDSIRVDNLPWFQVNGSLQSQINAPVQYHSSPSSRSPAFLGDLHDQSFLFGLDSEVTTEVPFYELSVPSSANLATAGPNMEVLKLFLHQGNAGFSSIDRSEIMSLLLPQLQIDIPELEVGEIEHKFDMLLRFSHSDNVLRVLELAVYLCSNNMLEHRRITNFVDWIICENNQPLLAAIVSNELPSAKACIQKIFIFAIEYGYLHVARTLLDTKLDFREILQASQSILEDAVYSDKIELIELFIEGGADIGLCDNLLHCARSIEAARLILEAGVDIDEEIEGEYRCTVLGRAVINYDFQLAQFLIEEGADVNLPEEDEDLGGLLTPLRAALELEDLELTQLLLDGGADVDAGSESWDEGACDHYATPLQVAAASGNVRLAELLLRKGATLKMCECEMSALHWAVKSRSTEMVQLLLDHGADPDTPAKNENRSTAIQLAAEQGDTDIVNVLMARGATIEDPTDICPLRARLRQEIRDGSIVRANAILQLVGDVNRPFSDQSTMIQEAILKNDLDMVQLLVSAGADVNMWCRSSIYPGRMVTPLQLALELLGRTVILGIDLNLSWKKPNLNRVQIVKTLLEKGASPNVSLNSVSQRSILHLAVAVKDYSEAYLLVELLLNYGALIDTPERGSHRGDTTLQYAVSRSSASTGFGLVQLLLGHHADINAPAGRNSGRTAIQRAVSVGDKELVLFLLENNADLNAPAGYNRGCTAIQEAVRIGDVEMVLFLLGQGADINLPAGNSYGRTALQQGVEMDDHWSLHPSRSTWTDRHLEIVKVLLEKGADINAPPATIGGRTALQAAAAAPTRKTSIKLIQYLLDAGANVNACAGPEAGLTALQGAAIQGHIKFALMLLEKNADVNAPGSKIDGRTALEGAAEHGRLDMVQLLINVGADSHLPGRQRYRSAARFAAKEGHIVVADLLKSRFED